MRTGLEGLLLPHQHGQDPKIAGHDVWLHSVCLMSGGLILQNMPMVTVPVARLDRHGQCKPSQVHYGPMQGFWVQVQLVAARGSNASICWKESALLAAWQWLSRIWQV